MNTAAVVVVTAPQPATVITRMTNVVIASRGSAHKYARRKTTLACFHRWRCDAAAALPLPLTDAAAAAAADDDDDDDDNDDDDEIGTCIGSWWWSCSCCRCCC